MCGLQGRKWKTNIKFEGRLIGQWLTENNKELSSQRSDCSEALEQVQGVYMNSHVDLSQNTTGIDTCLTSDHSDTTLLFANAATNQKRQYTVSLDDQSTSLQYSGIPNEELQTDLSINQTISNIESRMRNETHSLQKIISALTTRVNNLEEKLSTHLLSGEDHGKSSTDIEVTNVQQDADSNNNFSSTHEQFLLLQSQVESLTIMKQQNIKKEKQREIRNCNILLGNVEENTIESTLEVVKKIFEERMNVNLAPVHAVRLGKPKDGQKRLILVKMISFEEKLQLLKKARLLNGSGIYLMEDMSKEERKKRRILVNRMKKLDLKGREHISDTQMES